MTSLPDWLVERAALDEVAPANRDRIDRADPRELADQVAALRDANATELASHPAGPAVAQIEARIAADERRARQRRHKRLGLLGIASSAAAIAVVLLVVVGRTPNDDVGTDDADLAHPGVHDDVRVKGAIRLFAFRQTGDKAERLQQDSVVRAGDLIQLRYNAGGHGYGVIASVDGAGVVTLHFPVREDAPPEATAMSTKTTTLPHAYALDDAPRFERFFILTADEPLDVHASLAALRDFARRSDCAEAALDLPGVRQWSLRLLKTSSTNHESP